MKLVHFAAAAAVWAAVPRAEMPRSGVITVTDDNFDSYLYGDRDYHLVLYLASNSPQLNCGLCRDTQPQYHKVAHLYRHAYPDGDVFFLDAEFADAKKVFSLLQLETIPKLFHVPPLAPGAKASLWLSTKNEYPFFQGEQDELILQWVAELTGQSFELFSPPNYGRIAFNAVATFVAVLLGRRFKSQLGSVLRLLFVWGSAALVAILLFLAGHMFNQIRQTPFIREGSQGQPEYVAPSLQMQYGIETQAVSTVYGLLSLLVVLLVSRVGRIQHAKVQFAAAVAVLVVLYFAYSAYVVMFTVKSRGYPYQLFDFGIQLN